MGRLFTAFVFAALTTLGAAGANAQSAQPPVLVELFTSQGCSSCPPADAYLGEIADRDDIIALSLHVDYWDYLGWRDIFASPSHTQRQRNYAAMMRERMIYTPQVVVQGREHVVGSRTSDVDEAIARQAADASAAYALIFVKLNDDKLVAEIEPIAAAGRAKGRVLMAWYTRAETVKIQRGENSGRDIVYHNVVKGWADLGVWRGARTALTASKPMDADGVAIMIQANDGGPILAAGRLYFGHRAASALVSAFRRRQLAADRRSGRGANLNQAGAPATATPIMLSRLTSSASSASDIASVPSGRSGRTR
ncbi:MAG: DUF1223 domain-containing protein [Pseudomonadota bacterium]